MTPLVAALAAACPGFVASRDSEGLPYIWMGDFVRYVIGARLAGREDEVRRVFAIIEETVQPSRPGWKLDDESNLAVVGFLEDMQNGNLHPEGSRPGDFVAYLGPKSAAHWDSLNGFWEAVAHYNGRKP